MASEAARGQAALQISDYQTAIKHLSAALKESQSPLWLIQRSTAYQRSKQHELALADADNAVLVAYKRAKRELIATSQFRRAVALHGLGRFGDARMCLNWCNKVNEKEKGLSMWIAKVKKDYDDAGGDDAQCNRITVKEMPDPVEEVTGEDKGLGAEQTKGKENVRPSGKGKEKEVVAEAKPAAPAVPKPTTKDKVRHDWYQSTQSVTIDVLASGVPKEQADVKFTERALEISFPVPDSNDRFNLNFSPLWGNVNVAKCSFRVTPKKIEVTLSKATPGTKWNSLEGTAESATESNPSNTDEKPLEEGTSTRDNITTNKPDPKPDKGPAYPTSSRNGPKNWEKIADSKDDEEDKDGDPNAFFKMLYNAGDDDTKRAMMKSFQESAGTSLSTQWSDVKSKTFTPEPPDGMKVNQWER